MLEEAVFNLLDKLLGPFVRGLDRKSLNLSVWSGDVKLQGLEVRTEALEAFPLPLNILGATLGELRIKVPWRSLGKEPLIYALKAANQPDEGDENAQARVGTLCR